MQDDDEEEDEDDDDEDGIPGLSDDDEDEAGLEADLSALLVTLLSCIIIYQWCWPSHDIKLFHTVHLEPASCIPCDADTIAASCSWCTTACICMSTAGGCSTASLIQSLSFAYAPYIVKWAVFYRQQAASVQRRQLSLPSQQRKPRSPQQLSLPLPQPRPPRLSLYPLLRSQVALPHYMLIELQCWRSAEAQVC